MRPRRTPVKAARNPGCMARARGASCRNDVLALEDPEELRRVPRRRTHALSRLCRERAARSPFPGRAPGRAPQVAARPRLRVGDVLAPPLRALRDPPRAGAL